MIYVSLGDIFRRSDPVYGVAKLLNGVDQTSDVAGDIVQEVNGGHVAQIYRK